MGWQETCVFDATGATVSASPCRLRLVALGCGLVGPKNGTLQDINMRGVLAGYMSGLEFNAFERVCGILNLPSMSKSAWQTAQDHLNPIVEKLGDESMRRAAE